MDAVDCIVTWEQAEHAFSTYISALEKFWTGLGGVRDRGGFSLMVVTYTLTKRHT